MDKSIRKLAVIGAGTMGAAIAACGARAGLDVVLMVRGKGSETGQDRAARAVDSILKKGEMKGSDEARIRAGVFCADMQADAGVLKDCDLIIEAVAEDLAIKQSTAAFLFENAGEDAIVGTNTSNISIASIAENLPEEQQKRFLGIHFFNPVRYMDLVEIISGGKTEEAILRRVETLMNDRFGKTPIRCRDSAGFIANRIGSMALTSIMNATVDAGYGFAEADALTGDLIFRPKQGAFKLLDLVGLDISVHTVDYMAGADIPDYEKPFRNRPEVLYDITSRGYLGNKTGSGFYCKRKGAKGTERFVWDYNAREYVPLSRPQPASLAEVRDKAARLRTLLAGEYPETPFLRRVVLEPLWLAMKNVDEISYDFRDIDAAMRGGYNWIKGPFELCDLLGAKEVLALMEQQGLEPPAWAKEKIEKDGAFYAGAAPRAAAYLQLTDSRAVVMENKDAALCDLGDGVALFTLRTKANTYTTPAAELMLAAAEEVERSEAFRAMVVCNPGANLGAGANLYEVAGAIEAGQFELLEKSVEEFQRANLRLKYLKKPVVVAAKGQALGGSAELMLHAGCVVAHQELYAGLVEMGVGLVPSGGGCAELLFRATEGLQYGQMARIISEIDELVLPIAQAKYSMSAEEAMKNRYLRRGDLIIAKADALLGQAKATAIRLAEAGWRPPVKGTVTAAGESGYTHLMATVNVMLSGRMMTPYDAVIVEKLARIFSGGDALAGEQITEEDVLLEERKAFMDLCHNEKTLERIKGMVATGKPVRN